MLSTLPCISAIQKQLEFYFSDANLSQDGFFKWEILKSPDFSLKTDILLKCNRIRLLGATQEDILEAANRSDLLEVTDGDTAIRRKSAVSFLRTKNDCVVLATGLPSLPAPGCDSQLASCTQTKKKYKSVECLSDDLTISDVNGSEKTSQLIEMISSKLTQYGDVDYVKIPRFKTSSDIRGFAFIQFAKSESAQRAITDLGPTLEDLPATISEVKTPMETDSDMAADSAAWTPKMLAKAHLPLKDRLARQFVWRCCSRRSKQVVAAFRRLRASGYHLPNPLESEYRSIIGKKAANTENIEESKLLELQGLRILPYDDYLRWRPRFYTWLKAWTIRMNRKAEILQAMAERRRSMVTNNEYLTPVESASAKRINDKKTRKDVSSTDETEDSIQLLPNDFCSGTIVEIYWPCNLIVANCPPIVPAEKTPLEADNRHKIRLIRGFIERNFLQSNNLLKSVVHFDGNPSEEVINKIPNRLSKLAFLIHGSDFLRFFIRFCDRSSAERFEKLVKSVECVLPAESHVGEAVSSLTQADAYSLTEYFNQFPMGYLLDADQESVYCEAIIASKIGVRERRRKIQSKRRQRQKQHLDVKSHPSNFSVANPNKASQNMCKSTRIVFDN